MTALPSLVLEESDMEEPEELLSEELILPVSLTNPVPVTALPVLDEELTDVESVVIEPDEFELSQDARQKIAAAKIKIIVCFIKIYLGNFFLSRNGPVFTGLILSELLF